MKTSLYLQIPALVSLLTASVSLAQGAERWSMSVEQPPGNFISRVAQDFARQVRRETHGELEIQVAAGSLLFKRPQVKAAVARGEIALGELFMSALGDEDPLYELDSIPFLATDYEQAQRLWQASRPVIERRLLADGVRLLYAVPWPPQSLFSNRPIARMADFHGLRFRSYNPITARTATLLGAEPTSLTTEEVAEAFRSGRVDAMLTSSATGVDLRAWGFASHFYDVRAFIPKNIAIVNEAAFQRLSASARQALLNAAKRAERQGWELSWALAAYQVRMLERRGMSVEDQLPGEIRNGLAAIGRRLTWEWLAKAGEQGREVLDAYRDAPAQGRR